MTTRTEVKNRALGNLTAFLATLPAGYFEGSNKLEVYITKQNLACRISTEGAHRILYFNAGGIWHRDDESESGTHPDVIGAAEYIQTELPIE